MTLPAETGREISEQEIAALVDRFYAKVRQDPEIGPVFNTFVADWNEHLALLKDFWSSVLLASGRYKGHPMKAHIPLPIVMEYFDRWLELFEETAHEVMPAPLASMVVGKAERIAVSLKLGLYGAEAFPSMAGGV